MEALFRYVRRKAPLLASVLLCLFISELTCESTTLASSKVVLTIKSLFDHEWGMQKSPGLNLRAGWNVLVKNKLIKKQFDCSKSPIVVAIIDTGVDFNHSALKDSKWVNLSSGKNGYSGDVSGWDYITNSGKIIDGKGHGTHVAGIVSGKSSEPNGFQGVCPGVKIMSLRYVGEMNAGVKDIVNTVKAIRYAIDHGARIINYSAGGPAYSSDEHKALKEAAKKGVLVVTAAGNLNNDTKEKPYFPGSYELPNIISVAGVGESGTLIPTSNYGHDTVHLAAPGGGVLSLQPGERYGYMNGTSQATAFVTGLAALLWTASPKLKAEEIKNILTLSANKSFALKNKVKSEGYVDAEMAAKMLTLFNTNPKMKKPRARTDLAITR